MAKKKVTRKRTVKKAAAKTDVNKSREIKKALAAAPNKGPTEISEALTAKGIDVSPAYVSTIKTNLKTKTEAPKKTAKKKVAAKKRVTTKTKAAKKKAAKKRAPKATPATSISYDQLLLAKQMAQQLGGVEKAKATLAALSELAND